MASLKRREKKYHAQYYVAGKQKRVALDTSSFQIAKEKKRKIESAQLRGIENPLPTRTPTADVITAYVDHIRTTKTFRSVRSDLYYFRQAFGPNLPGT